MPFDLTNAPATFQSLMNDVFRKQLRESVLVFFDDIQVYSPTFQGHVEHLREVLELLKQHKLFAKRSKCSFAQQEVEYLGHIIFGEGVSADPKKVQCMLTWPKPDSVKKLKGFLGLTGYYGKFVRDMEY